jgi:hypothetical protein
MIRVNAKTKAIEIELTKTGKNIQRAMELSIDRTLDEIKDSVWSQLPKFFDRPTPYTLNSLQVTKTQGHNMRGSDKGKKMEPRSYLPTPTVCGNYNRKGAIPTSGDGLATVVGGALNPPWVEWLMGWPIGWTGCEPLETDKCHSALLRHG